MKIILECADQADLAEIMAKLEIIEGKLAVMATQEQIDALVAQVDQLGSDLNTAVQGIQGDLDALKAANPGVDITALQASVGNLANVVAAAQAVDAENPAPAPAAPADAPADVPPADQPPADGQPVA